MKEHFLKVLSYNAWSNRRFMTCMLGSTVMNNKIFLLFSHLLTAEAVWLSRAQGGIGPVEHLWEVYPNDVLQRMLEENSQAWYDYIQACDKNALSGEVTYNNSKGEAYTTRLDDIITHFVNHGTHHRAQIASMLQQEKVEAPVSDYIAFIREQQPALGV